MKGANGGMSAALIAKMCVTIYKSRIISYTHFSDQCSTHSAVSTLHLGISLVCIDTVSLILLLQLPSLLGLRPMVLPLYPYVSSVLYLSALLISPFVFGPTSFPPSLYPSDLHLSN